MVITSVNNEKIKEVLKLKNKKYRDKEGLFLVETYHLVEEAYVCGLLEEVFLLEGEECKYNVENTYVSLKVMDKLKDTISEVKIIGVVRKRKLDKLGNRILLLDRVQDPGNLGTIIRSAVAFGFDNVVVSRDSVDIYNSKVLRSTQGMLFKIAVWEEDLVDFILKLKKEEFVVWGTDVQGGTDVSETEWSSKVAIVLGNEGRGVSLEVKELCDKNLYIPMNKDCESLNVGVAASIIMYEVSKNEGNLSR